MKMNEIKVLAGISTVLACVWTGFYVYTLEYDWYIAPMYLTLLVIGVPALFFALDALEDMGLI